MIIAYSAALAEYIEHIFYFQCMIVWLTDCMIGQKHTILVLVIMVWQIGTMIYDDHSHQMHTNTISGLCAKHDSV